MIHVAPAQHWLHRGGSGSSVLSADLMLFILELARVCGVRELSADWNERTKVLVLEAGELSLGTVSLLMAEVHYRLPIWAGLVVYRRAAG